MTLIMFSYKRFWWQKLFEDNKSSLSRFFIFYTSPVWFLCLRIKIRTQFCISYMYLIFKPVLQEYLWNNNHSIVYRDDFNHSKTFNCTFFIPMLLCCSVTTPQTLLTSYKLTFFILLKQTSFWIHLILPSIPTI